MFAQAKPSRERMTLEANGPRVPPAGNGSLAVPSILAALSKNRTPVPSAEALMKTETAQTLRAFTLAPSGDEAIVICEN